MPAKQKAEVLFVGVSTAVNKPGLKLTKSLFRQIIHEDIPEHDGRRTVAEGVKVLGWVNYWWPDCCSREYLEENKFNYIANGMCSWNYDDNDDENDEDGHGKVLHVLWKTESGDYRRGFLPDYDPLYETVEKLPQLYLNGFCLD